jgi:hypothetical protein
MRSEVLAGGRQPNAESRVSRETAIRYRLSVIGYRFVRPIVLQSTSHSGELTPKFRVES